MKKILYLVPVVALLAAGCGSTPKSSNQPQPSGQNQQGNPSNSGQQNSAAASSSPSSMSWTGTLKISDNPAKGNLMLVMTDTIVYIKTSRDWSKFLNTEVRVSHEGTTDNFILKDIWPINEDSDLH